MKISKLNFLRILTKYFVKSLGISSQNYHQESLIQSVTPIFNTYAPSLKTRKILDSEDRIDISLLEKELLSFFAICPIIRLPAKNVTFSITVETVKEFLKDLKNHCDKEEVICLPCQK